MGHYYPVFLSLEGCRCLIVGLGQVGCRKLEGVLAARVARVLALDLRPRAELGSEAQSLLECEQVTFCQRPWQPGDALDSFLVFACTDDDEENKRLAIFCKLSGILCNCATSPPAGNFILPSVAHGNGLVAALSTGGQSPFLAKRWRDELQQWLAAKSRMARLLGQLRPLVLALGLPSSSNRELFSTLASPELETLLDTGGIRHVGQWLRARLPESAHKELDQILEEFTDGTN